MDFVSDEALHFFQGLAHELFFEKEFFGLREAALTSGGGWNFMNRFLLLRQTANLNCRTREDWLALGYELQDDARPAYVLSGDAAIEVYNIQWLAGMGNIYAPSMPPTKWEGDGKLVACLEHAGNYGYIAELVHGPAIDVALAMLQEITGEPMMAEWDNIRRWGKTVDMLYALSAIESLINGWSGDVQPEILEVEVTTKTKEPAYYIW